MIAAPSLLSCATHGDCPWPSPSVGWENPLDRNAYICHALLFLIGDLLSYLGGDLWVSFYKFPYDLDREGEFLLL